MTSANLIHESGHPKLVLWDNSEGWGGKRGGRRVQDGGTHVHPRLIHVDVWRKPPQYCKVTGFQLKERKKERKERKRKKEREGKRKKECYSPVARAGFSLWWLLLLRSVGSRVLWLQELQLVASVVAALGL